MKNLIAVGFVVALVACNSKTPNNTLILLDSSVPVDVVAVGACSPLTQLGCDPGMKCAWVLSTDDTATANGLGAIGCAPNGTVALDAACVINKVAMGGYDNCKSGLECVSGKCKSICDPNGGAPMCPAAHACAIYSGIFANEGVTPIPAGVCDPTCSPLDDNDFDGSGAKTKIGTACKVTEGCYGFPDNTAVSSYSCAPVGSSTLVHRSAVAAPQHLNSCLSGYELGLIGDAEGSMQIDCFAWCSPSETYMGNPAAATQAPNGITPHRCNNNDALGNFTGGSPNGQMPATNGEHCMFSWWFEEDMTNLIHVSPTSDTLGICIDHTKYKYASVSGGMADTVWPPCAAMVATSATVIAAADLGCVKVATSGLTTAFEGKVTPGTATSNRLKYGIVGPEFPNLRKSAASSKSMP